MDISIIIVSYNTKDYLRNCLSSFYNYLTGVVFEIIVVDNNSEDGSPEMVKREFPDVKLILNDGNYGFAKANNRGFEHSTGEFILFINSDCELKDDSIFKLLDYAKEHGDVGIAGPKLAYPDGTFQPSVGRFPSFYTEISDNLLISRIPFISRLFEGRYDRKCYSHTKEVDWITGACILVRREAYKEAGMFDERYFMYMEDIDLSKKMADKGWKVIHHLGKSSEQTLRNIVEIKCRSLQAYYREFLNKFNIVFINLSALVGYTVRISAELLLIPFLGNRYVYKLKVFFWSLIFTLRYFK